MLVLGACVGTHLILFLVWPQGFVIPGSLGSSDRNTVTEPWEEASLAEATAYCGPVPANTCSSLNEINKVLTGSVDVNSKCHDTGFKLIYSLEDHSLLSRQYSCSNLNIVLWFTTTRLLIIVVGIATTMTIKRTM